MGRENKKEAVAILHREQIMKGAEELFSEKGFLQTTIADISKASEYSRRTIYAYFESKEDILHHIIAKGLQSLKQNIEDDLENNADFLAAYFAICRSLKKYQAECPHSLENVTRAKTGALDLTRLSPVVQEIFSLGDSINRLLADFIAKGRDQGIVRKGVDPGQTVYILWSNITSLLTLIQTKGSYIARAFSISQDDFWEYGLKQIINAILEERI
ncbi:MAG: TetR/AcrR family transcriptional regulator [Bacillota bacterium]|nr:TetR/AcrR family transcriptional regulator [Bacillota bacterium]